MMRKTIVLVVVLIVSFGIGVFYPFETTVVPAWKVRVIDEKGVPYQGKRVDESWLHYSLEFHPPHGEERWTDGSGSI